MAKVILLGSLANSVGGVVPPSRISTAATSVKLKANAQVSAKAELEVSAKAEASRMMPKHKLVKAVSTKQSQIKTPEDRTMKNSIKSNRNWWTASLLGGPVDGSSN
jgi:hypothetical protein